MRHSLFEDRQGPLDDRGLSAAAGQAKLRGQSLDSVVEVLSVDEVDGHRRMLRRLLLGR